MLSMILALSMSPLSGAEDSPNFKQYADDFRTAVLLKDEARVRALVGDATLFSGDNIRYAFDSDYFHSFGSDSRSIREILDSENLTTTIDSFKTEGVWQATIAFVPRGKLASDSRPILPQLKQLTVMKDYVLCEVISDDGVIRMRDHFCFAETDILQDP